MIFDSFEMSSELDAIALVKEGHPDMKSKILGRNVSNRRWAARKGPTSHNGTGSGHSKS
jgi:hypothetical protein